MDVSYSNVLEGARQYFTGLPVASNPAGRENDGSVHSEQHSAIPYWDQQTTEQNNMNTQQQTNRPQQNYYEKHQNYPYPVHYQQPHPPSSSYYEVPNQVTYPTSHSSVPNHTNHQVSHSSAPTHPNHQANQTSTPIHVNHQVSHSSAASHPNQQVSHSSAPNLASHSSAVNHQNHQVSHSSAPSHASHQVSHSGAVNHQNHQVSHSSAPSHASHQVSHSNAQSHPNQQVSHSSAPSHPNQQASHSSAPSHPNQQVSHSSAASHPNHQVSHSSVPSHASTPIHANHQVSHSSAPGHQNAQSHSNHHLSQSSAASHANHQASHSSVGSHGSYTTSHSTGSSQRQYNYQNAGYYSGATPSSSQGQEYNYNKMYNSRNSGYQGGFYHHPHHQQGGTPGAQVSTSTNQRAHTVVQGGTSDYRQNYQNKPVVPTSTNQRTAQPVNGANASSEYYKYYNAGKYGNTNQYSPVPPQNYQQKVVVPTKQAMAYLPQKPAMAKQKRESPLDLSVKTVKTSADSTLDFEERNYRVMMQQYQSARAPKVDFLPNFNMPRDSKPAQQGIYYPNYPNGNTKNVAESRESLPRIEFPAISRRTVLESQRKRAVEAVGSSEVPEKIAKIDTWRQNIDKQIEQRLSSYTKSRTEGDYLQHSNYQYAYQNKVGTKAKPGNKQTATKKVLNLLRNSLQIKGQKKMEQEHLKQNYREIQQPSTDVLAPLQPKPGILGRRNVSPFTAASLERNSATPSTAYKLHIPKAIDSVIFSEEAQAQTANADLDGLAAYLAARIRTKAELKQVGPSQNTQVINTQIINNNNNNKESVIVANKVVIEANSPKKLFNRYEGLKQPRDIRSSSETSVFDFPDSDNEAEIPVLGRKDRKTIPAQFTGVTEDRENERPVSPFDLIFNQTCDTFMEQLKNGCGKKRGRRKKTETKEKIEDIITVKIEEPEEEVKITEEIKEEEVVNKVDHTSDSDTPLSKLIKVEKIEEPQPLPLSIYKPGKKPTFGDGSGFHPGWEMELYRYKKSLRMPRMLIQVTRPPNCSRLSTSLPDLDPSPISPQSITSEDRKKHEDSDIDSNCSFNFSITRTNYDSEEGSSSVKSLKSSISDKLLERYAGARKKKRIKKLEEPKIIPKTETPLLATPSLEDDKNTAILGFRKKTINNFKDVFSQTPVNEFATVVLNSRTRKETRVLKQKATIREVFGEDRPASAPPITCLEEEIKIEKKPQFNQSLNDIFIKAISNKIIKKEDDIKKEDHPLKKKSKLRTIRRKFSSGFDYIRKKKKNKKEDFESDVTVKPKKRAQPSKSNPESIQDIQKEIKMWVLNKGVGETHLHRASRLGFTDIAAYCLENMACNPSPRDNAGYTPLHEACSKGHLDIAKLLLQYGAHVSESAQGGIRPLHEAAENGFVEIVRLLLSFGADPTLATYSGITPLQLAVDETTVNFLQEHIAELQGKPSPAWSFNGPTSCFDSADLGYDVLCDVPEPDKPEQEQDLEIEVSEQMLPNLYYFQGQESERWMLLQDLSNILKIKSKETLLRQLNVVSSNINKSDIVKELKTVEFLEKARCCQFLNANEKLNTRSSKVYLVKYTEKVKSLLNVESELIHLR